MAFWGAPHALEDHVFRACRAALRTTRRLARLRERWSAEGLPAIRAGVGLDTGELVVGNMGSRTRLNYTVIGDPVNVAARLEGLNKAYDTEIRMGEQTHALVASRVVTRRIDRVAGKGKQQGANVYELLALEEEASQGHLNLADAYEAALGLYLARRLADAEAAFHAILEERPYDGPSRVLLDRCRASREEEPAPDWNGVHVMRRK